MLGLSAGPPGKYRKDRGSGRGLIVLDDVVIRKFGEKVEKKAYVRDPVARKAVPSYNPVILRESC